jgi:hypothetical protein
MVYLHECMSISDARFRFDRVGPRKIVQINRELTRCYVGKVHICLRVSRIFSCHREDARLNFHRRQQIAPQR